MINWLWNNFDWLAGGSALFTAAVWLKRAYVVSKWLSLFDLLGPFGEPLRETVEFIARVVAAVLLYVLKSLYKCVFNEFTWGAIFAAYLAGSFFPVQKVKVTIGLKHPAAVHHVVKSRIAKRPQNQFPIFNLNPFK